MSRFFCKRVIYIHKALLLAFDYIIQTFLALFLRLSDFQFNSIQCHAIAAGGC